MESSGTILQSNPDSETFPRPNKVIVDDGIILQLILDRPSGVKVGKEKRKRERETDRQTERQRERERYIDAHKGGRG